MGLNAQFSEFIYLFIDQAQFYEKSMLLHFTYFFIIGIYIYIYHHLCVACLILNYGLLDL